MFAIRLGQVFDLEHRDRERGRERDRQKRFLYRLFRLARSRLPNLLVSVPRFPACDTEAGIRNRKDPHVTKPRHGADARRLRARASGVTRPSPLFFAIS